MRVLRIAGLVLCCLCFTAAEQAQVPRVLTLDKPVWTFEFIKAKPGKAGLTLSYLDEHWMFVREAAKRQGTVLSYHRISEFAATIPGVKSADPEAILLLTEYKNLKAFQEREKVFGPIAAQLAGMPPVVMSPSNPDALYETVDTRVFTEERGAETPRFVFWSPAYQ